MKSKEMNNVNFIALVWHQIIIIFMDLPHTMYNYIQHRNEAHESCTCTLVFYRESSIHNIFLYSAKILRHDNLAQNIAAR